MSSYFRTASFAAVVASFAAADGLPFADVLSRKQLLDICFAFHLPFCSKESLSPAVTLWAWLSQCLDARKSCRAAVARLRAVRESLDLPLGSLATGGYCQARAALPVDFLRHLTLHTGMHLEQLAPDSWRWHNRRVILADGSTVSMPDTPDNQLAFPQPTTQNPGLGFPKMRLVSLIDLATGGVLGCAMGPYSGKETGETALLLGLLEHLRAGDVLLADRFYCTYWIVTLLAQRGVQVCFRLHHLRLSDFAAGEVLGPNDHISCWPKPARPAWLEQSVYDALPQQVVIREVRRSITNRDGQDEMLVVATTLRDGQAYPEEDICDLYNGRWNIELDLRSIKQTLHMDILSCNSAAMVRKEVWVHLLAYNLVRAAMARACQMNQAKESAKAAKESAKAAEQEVKPRQVSFSATLQSLLPFAVKLMNTTGERTRSLVEQILAGVVGERVGKRPHRREPRKVKRRRNKYKNLTKPRLKKGQKEAVVENDKAVGKAGRQARRGEGAKKRKQPTVGKDKPRGKASSQAVQPKGAKKG